LSATTTWSGNSTQGNPQPATEPGYPQGNKFLQSTLIQVIREMSTPVTNTNTRKRDVRFPRQS